MVLDHFLLSVPLVFLVLLSALENCLTVAMRGKNPDRKLQIDMKIRSAGFSMVVRQRNFAGEGSPNVFVISALMMKNTRR